MITISPVPNAPLWTLPLDRLAGVGGLSVHGGVFLDHDHMPPNRISDPGVAEYLRHVPCPLIVATGAGNAGNVEELNDPMVLVHRRAHSVEHFIGELDRMMDVANAHGIRLAGVRMDESMTKLITTPGHPYLPPHRSLFESNEVELVAEQVARFVRRARHHGLRVTLTEVLWVCPWAHMEKALTALQTRTPIDVLELDCNWWVRGGWRDNLVRLLGRTPAVERQRHHDVGYQLWQAKQWCLTHGVDCVPIIGSPFIPQRIIWETPSPERPVICRDDAEFVASAKEQIGLARYYLDTPDGSWKVSSWTIDSWEDGPTGGYPKTVPSMAGLLRVKELL